MKKTILGAAFFFTLIGCGRDRFGERNLLVLNVSSFTFSAPACGSDPPAQTLNIIGEGEWRASSDVPWMTLSPTSGGVPATVTLTLSINGLACGQSYSGTLTITSPRGNSMPLPVTLTIPGPPAITLNPASLAFNSPACGSNPASQTFQITTGGGPLNWSASNIPSWLTLTPAGGAAPAAVTAAVDVTGLVCGKSYTQTVNIASAQAANSPAALTVTLTIPSAPATTPVIGLSRTFISFAAACGGTAAPQTFDISNAGIGTLNWTGGASQPWAAINPPSGTLAAGTSTTITVTVNATGLPCGATSSAAVTLTSPDAPNSPQTVAINVIVPTAAVITPSGTNLSFFAPACKVNPSPNSQSFTITNTGGTALTWNASSDSAWATVSPATGTLAPGAASGNITVTVDATTASTPCAQGSSATITFNGAGGPVTPQTVHVGLSVPGAWQFQNPIPTGNHLGGAAFSDVGIAWTVGDAGTILRSENDGNNWTPVASGTSANLNAIAFASPLEGWTVGAGGTILHTTDGGATWGVESAPVSSSLHSLAIVDAAHVWAVGDNGTIIYRNNSAWSNLSDASRPSAQFTHIFMNDATHGWITGNKTSTPTAQYLLWTPDNWTTISDQQSTIPPNPNTGAIAGVLSSIFFLPSTAPVDGWAVGDPDSAGAGVILHIHAADLSAPGAITWETSGVTVSLYDIFFSDLSNGWAVGAGGALVHTTDGGGNWAAQTSNTTQILFSLGFKSGNGIAVGFSGTVERTPDGTNWIPSSGGSTSNLNAVSFADANNGWAVGAGITNTILHTTDGGVTWSGQLPAVTLNGVSAISANEAWAAGIGGNLYHYTGASPWAATAISGSVSYKAIQFIDSLNGWAVGSSGTIVHTSNDSAWGCQLSGLGSGTLSCTVNDANFSGVTLNAVYFSDSSNGWAVGSNGIILHTSNGGSSWTCQLQRSVSSLTCATTDNAAATTWNSVYFVSATEGWTVGSSGVIYHTISGGTTWSSQNSGTASTLFGVRFADASNGWVVGGGGLVLATTSGGSTWAPQSMVGTTQTLRSLYFTDLLNGWAVGAGGTILHTATGGNN